MFLISKREFSRGKQPKIYHFINRLINVFLLIFTIEVLVWLVVLSLETSTTKELVKYFGGNTNFLYIRRCLQVIIQTSCTAPLMLNAVVDLLNFLFVLHCENTNTFTKEK